MATELREQLQATLGNSYILEQELGGGGMSRVFVAQEAALGRKVVIKVLPPEMAAAVNIDRFRREIQLDAKLQHPHIVPLLSAGETNGLPYFIMPYVRGESLRARLVREGELPVAEAVRVLRELALALSYAHENNVVHRDIKPENVLISGGSAVVTDFGVAKALKASSGTDAASLTSMDVALGTPAYMAPEQATADPHSDHRADIYALGVIGYEMLAGATPFAGRSRQATLAAHVTEKPEDVGRRRTTIPPNLARIVMRCLEKRAADRPQSAHEVMDQLDLLGTPAGGLTRSVAFPPARRSRTLLPMAALVVIVLGGMAAYQMRRANVISPATANMSEMPHSRSIAVLPFTNMSGDPANEYFSDGLTEELLNVLSQIPGLRVAARTSSFQFKGKTADIREVGQRLGVATVLEGSVRKSDDRMRITAQLIDAKSGYHMWSKAFDRKVADVFAVQDEITKAIGEALQVQLAGATPAHRAETGPENQAAHELYLKGLFSWNQRTEKGIRNAVRYYQAAVDKDPNYAIAYAALARAFLSLESYGYMSSSEALPRAKRASERALQLDPTSVVAHVSRANLLVAQTNWDGAEAELSRVIESNPNYSDAHRVYGNLLVRRGRAQEGLKELQMAQKLDPIALPITLNVAIVLTFVRDNRRALNELDNALTLSPDNPMIYSNMATALAYDGQHSAAINAGEKSVALAPEDPLMSLGLAFIYAKTGNRQKALEIVRAEEKKPSAIEYAAELSAAYGALGEKDLAFKWLRRLPNIQGVFLKADPMFDPIRGDPRFDRILARWKLN